MPRLEREAALQRLYLPYISPISPLLYLPYISQARLEREAALQRQPLEGGEVHEVLLAVVHRLLQ